MALPIDYKRIINLQKRLGEYLERLAIERDLSAGSKYRFQLSKSERRDAFQTAFSIVFDVSKHLVMRIYKEEVFEPWSAFQRLSKEKVISHECANGLQRLAFLFKEIQHYRWKDYSMQIREAMKRDLRSLESFSSQLITFMMCNPPDNAGKAGKPLSFKPMCNNK